MASNDLVLMDTKRIARSLKRMAHEIVEQNTENNPIVLFGIDGRGYAIGKDLADLLKPMSEEKVEANQLMLKDKSGPSGLEQLSLPETDQTFLIVVDDVIFSGKTMFTALKKISDHFNPTEIHTAVLVDRGHRKFPVQAEFCGLNLPTKPQEHVSVIVDKMNVEKTILHK